MANHNLGIIAAVAFGALGAAFYNFVTSIRKNDDKNIESIKNAHMGYDLYPCFFIEEGPEMRRIGSLQDFMGYIDSNGGRERLMKHKFSILCLHEGCLPCKRAKDWIAKEFQKKGPQLKIDILERNGSEYDWAEWVDGGQIEGVTCKTIKTWEEC